VPCSCATQSYEGCYKQFNFCEWSMTDYLIERQEALSRLRSPADRRRRHYVIYSLWQTNSLARSVRSFFLDLSSVKTRILNFHFFYLQDRLTTLKECQTETPYITGTLVRRPIWRHNRSCALGLGLTLGVQLHVTVTIYTCARRAVGNKNKGAAHIFFDTYNLRTITGSQPRNMFWSA